MGGKKITCCVKITFTCIAYCEKIKIEGERYMKHNEELGMLEFDDKKVVGKAKIEVELTEDDIGNIMINGLEGGIGYWAGLNNSGSLWEEKPKGEPLSTWATKIILEGHSVKFYDVEDEEEEWELTLEKLINGYAQNFKERPFDNNVEEGDAITVDCIIQYALFGKLVYG